MRFIVVLAAIFSACCCLSILNLFSFQTTDLFHREKRALLNNTTLRCKNFTLMIVKHLNYRLTEEELQDILSQCRLFLQQNSTLLRSTDENDSNQSSSFRNNRSQEHDFTTEEHLATKLSTEMNVKITGTNENPTETSERGENYDKPTSAPLFDKNEDLKETSIDRIIKPTTESPGLWGYFFGSKEQNEGNSTDKPENRKTGFDKVILSSTSTSWSLWNYLFGTSDKNESNSTEKPAIKPENQKTGVDNLILNSTSPSWSLWNYLFGTSEQDQSNSTKKPTEEPENQKTELNTMIGSLTNTSWSLWNYVFGVSDSRNSSSEIRPLENLVRGTITEPSIYFENSTDSEYSTTVSSIWNLVMPGTKWCGSGNIAENDDDLGYFEDVDRCCRTHDKCNDIMIPGESKYNLTNTSPFTVLNCKCDDDLYNCLGEIDSVAANTVGNTFFNIFARNCYILDYPRICKRYYTLLGCQEYVIDETAEKVFQWKPAKKYLKMPFTISG